MPFVYVRFNTALGYPLRYAGLCDARKKKRSTSHNDNRQNESAQQMKSKWTNKKNSQYKQQQTMHKLLVMISFELLRENARDDAKSKMLC